MHTLFCIQPLYDVFMLKILARSAALFPAACCLKCVFTAMGLIHPTGKLGMEEYFVHHKVIRSSVLVFL